MIWRLSAGALLAGLLAGPAAEPAAVPLPATSLERSLAGGETHLYEVDVGAGQFLHLEVEQRGVDVVVELRAEGETLAFDSPTGRDGVETLAVVREAASKLRIAVTSPAPEATAGQYTLRRIALRHARAADRTRAAAERRLLAAHSGYRARTEAGLRQAIDGYRAVLEPFRRLGDQRREILALRRLGLAHRRLGENGEALAWLGRALDLCRQIGDEAGEAATLNQIGLAHMARSDHPAARAALTAALAIWARLGDAPRQARVANNLGLLHQRAGRFDLARDAYRDAYEAFRQAGDRRRQAIALNNLAIVEEGRKAPAEAVESYRRAAQLAREAGDERTRAEASIAHGRLRARFGEVQFALDSYLEALAVLREMGDRSRQAAVLDNLGALYLQLRAPKLALETLAEALELQRAVEDRRGQGTTLLLAARAHADLGHADRAEAIYRLALELWRDLEDPRRAAATSMGLGALHLSTGAPRRALEPLDLALKSYRRLELTDDLASTHRLLGRARRELGEIDAARGHLEAALDAARGAGSRLEQSLALAELARVAWHRDDLPAARQHVLAAVELAADLRTGIAADDLRTSYFSRLAEVYEVAVETFMRSERRHRGAGHMARALELADRGRAQGLLDLLRASRLEPGRRPRLAELRDGDRGVGLVAARRHLLDQDTLLLQFFLGEQGSYLWVVSGESIAGYELPGRGVLERAVAAIHDLPGPDDPRRGGARRAAYARLGRLLLGPAAPAIAGWRRLAIVPDGALCYVPFAALSATGDGEPLVIGHEIVHLPSMRVLEELRRPPPDRPPATGRLAVLADPAYGAGLPALPWSRREAEAIVAHTDPGDDVWLALGHDSSRPAALSDRLARYRIVHFATHGTWNARRPELSGLELSSVDPQGAARDGTLRLEDVYGLRLGADLVVLSGCATALGEEVRGEGLVGLTRGFLHAGAARVVASLWPVRDRATAELMSRFYAALLTDGRAPAAALRQAQLALRQDPRTRDPYYWAAFVMQGDWR